MVKLQVICGRRRKRKHGLWKGAQQGERQGPVELKKGHKKKKEALGSKLGGAAGTSRQEEGGTNHYGGKTIGRIQEGNTEH